MSKELDWLDYMEGVCKEFLSRKDEYMRLTFTTEQAVEVLKEIDTIKQVSLKSQEQKKVIDIIKKKCSSSNSNLWLVTCVHDYTVYMAFINDVSNHDHDLVRAEHNVLTEEEFNLLKRYMVDKEEPDEKN